MKKNAFADSIKILLNEANGEDILVETLIHHLQKKGQAALLIFFSLPFCQPIQIPGMSTPFGLVLAFIGSRIAFGHRIWLPKWILNKKIPYQKFKKIADVAIKLTDKLLFLVSTRLIAFVKGAPFVIMHGVTILLLGLILALPLPLPLSNVLAAYPLLAFGLGLLEEDGAALIVAYVFSFICFFVVGLVIWIGKVSLTAVS